MRTLLVAMIFIFGCGRAKASNLEASFPYGQPVNSYTVIFTYADGTTHKATTGHPRAHRLMRRCLAEAPERADCSRWCVRGHDSERHGLR